LDRLNSDAPMVITEDVVRRIAAEYAFIDAHGRATDAAASDDGREALRNEY
jgi:hypothetical protein